MVVAGRAPLVDLARVEANEPPAFAARKAAVLLHGAAGHPAAAEAPPVAAGAVGADAGKQERISTDN